MLLDAIHGSHDRGNSPVLVTGAAGFLGSRITAHLIQEGIPVIGIVRSTSPERLQRLGQCASSGMIKLVECDLLDHRAMESLISTSKPSRCIHAAWSVAGKGYRSDPINQKWVHASLRLFEMLRLHSCRWMGVLGTCIEPQRGCAPCCRYSAAKSTLQNRLHELASRTSNFPKICWLRVFQPYGPGEQHDRLIPSLVNATLCGNAFRIESPHEVRDFIHVNDVATAVVQSLKYVVAGTFDVGTGIGTRIGDVAELCASLCGAAASNVVSITTAAPTSSTHIAQPAALKTACQWQAAVDLHTGLANAIAAAKRNARAAA